MALPRRFPLIARGRGAGRRALLLAGFALAIGCGDARVSSGGAIAASGPDAVLLRVPAAGGTALAHRAGDDSTLWSSRSRVPASERLLGFDDFLGIALLREPSGHISSLDLRLGTVTRLADQRLPPRLVAEGAAVFGLEENGRIVRLTPSVTWSWPVPGGATALVPTPDGSLLVISTAEGRSRVIRIVPPESRTLDSATIGAVRLAARTLSGDRLWAVTADGLVSLRTRDLSQAFELRISDSIVGFALTPSGDRAFVATDEDELRIVDRYAERERGRVALPGRVTDLRMDPDGHYLLAKAAGVDSAYVISIGTERVVGTLASAWRDDLPLVTPDGRVLVVQGDHAVLLDAESGRERLRYRNGAADRWLLIRYNGFRPRAAGLDRPVEFEEYAQDSASADSALTAMIYGRYGDLGSVGRAAPMENAPAPPPAQRPTGTDLRGTWSVSFATMMTEDRAKSMADSIVVDGRRARVVPGLRDGVQVWRVLLGPFETRQAAERAGMASRLSYWVFEGAP
ncbi:MAG TPA: SPOR domain-containing protein [Gemmatimonadaceae bacterium]|nr:SPOR domain-containing protein [Gemmatimonadaceae bacterium]